MAEPYWSREDVRMRLNRTICMHKGVPVYVTVDEHGPSEGNMVETWPLGSSKGPTYVDYTDDNFEYKAPPLGYAFWKGRAHYISRLPERRQRQGLTVDSLVIEPPLPDGRRGDLFRSKAVVECITGKHRSVSDALIMVERGDAESVPIHRQVAIGWVDTNRTLGLFYRLRLIGIRNNTIDRFELIQAPDTSFYERILNRIGVDL